MPVAVVFGTYNRLALLKRAVESTRNAINRNDYKLVIIDGGSTDGSREWLVEQSDVVLLRQELPLTGAVAAFNLGFAFAVDNNYDWICHGNDDAEFVTPGMIDDAIALLKNDPKIGEVAFAYDLYKPGDFRFSNINGKPYANYGVIRREAGMAVAIEQGDPTGRAWWNPIYRTYAADTEFGVQLHRLDWAVHCARELHVRDHNAQDDMRKLNEKDFVDSKLFWSRWRDTKLG
jgi:GT2 family glycosyltransferase